MCIRDSARTHAHTHKHTRTHARTHARTNTHTDEHYKTTTIGRGGGGRERETENKTLHRKETAYMSKIMNAARVERKRPCK